MNNFDNGTEGFKPKHVSQQAPPTVNRQAGLFGDADNQRNLSTKERLQLAALELFATKGIRATTIRDIAKVANIAEGSLYRHYTGKQDLAATLYQELASQVQYDLRDICNTAADLESFLSSLVAYLCDLYDRQPLCYQYIFLTPRSTFQQDKTKGGTAKENSGGDRALPFPETEITGALEEYFEWVASSFPEKKRRSSALVTAQLFGTVHHTTRWCEQGLLDKPLSGHTEELLLAILRLVQEP